MADCSSGFHCLHYLALHEALVLAYRALLWDFGFIFHSNRLCYTFSNLCRSRIYRIDMDSLASASMC